MLWLAIAALPVLLVGVIASEIIDKRLTGQSEAQLSNYSALEVGRLNEALTSQEQDANIVASGLDLRDLMESISEARSMPDTGNILIRTADGRVIRPNSPEPLNGVARSIVLSGNESGSEIQEIRISARDGQILARTAGFSWEPYNPELVDEAMETRRSMFGNAFFASDAELRLGLAVPVITDDGAVLGAIEMEIPLEPIVALAQQYEGFASTSEANLYQRGADGEPELISSRRFDRGAVLDAADDPLPRRSLLISQSDVTIDRDYRNERAIAALEPIDATGWGLVVKIDESEALALQEEFQRFVVLALAIMLLVMLLGWIFQVGPLGRRITRTAEAADRVASGDYQSLIGDTSTDEIGNLARSIDRLASDLEEDIRAREFAEAKLRYRADHDALTGLINRQRASGFIEEYAARNIPVSLLFLDLDGFKEINDSYGHGAGDEVLVATAHRLEGCFPDPATIVARWGGDEFLVILPEAREPEAADAAAAITEALTQPVTTSAGSHLVRASIGVSTSSAGVAVEDLVHSADAEMFHKKHNRASYRKISPAAVRLVEAALVANRVEPYFQPVVRVGDNDEVELIGAEVLMRIRNNDGTVLLPGAYLPPLGASDLAGALDMEVMKAAFAITGGWLRDGTVPPNFRVAVNLGAASIGNPDVATEMLEHMKLNNLSGESVLVEIPETVDAVPDVLIEQFAAAGVALAIDDVGCQNSNLERMVDLPASVAKIDRRWVTLAGNTELETAIGRLPVKPVEGLSVQGGNRLLDGIVSFCRILDMDIVAEGVETEAQLEHLRGLGINTFQGYYFGEPQAAIDFEKKWSAFVGSDDTKPQRRRKPQTGRISF